LLYLLLRQNKNTRHSGLQFSRWFIGGKEYFRKFLFHNK
jgi:hypothetical protein